MSARIDVVAAAARCAAYDASQARAATTIAAVPVFNVGSMTGANLGE